MGDGSYRATLLDAAHEAERLANSERLAAAALASDRLVASGMFVEDEWVEIIERLLENLPIDHPQRAVLVSILCKHVTFRTSLERRTSLADEAVRLAEEQGDDATLVRVRASLISGLIAPPLLSRCLAESAECLWHAQNLGDPTLLFLAAARRRLIAAWAGDFDETDRCMEIVASMAERLEQPTFLWYYIYTSATQAMIAGDTDEAERLAREALEIGIESGQPDAASQFGAQIMTVAAQRGTMGELAPLILQATVNLPALPAFRGALAMAYVEGDRNDEARSVLESFATTGFELPLDVSWLTGMTCSSEAAIECRGSRFGRPALRAAEAVGDPVC